jgi:succinate dehydrogenase / fumarate reductase cytochrome b subunit
MNPVCSLFRSSIGRKFLMAVSGLILIAFVIGHLVGNLQVFSHPDHLNGYAQFLHNLGPLLWVARAVIILSVLIHVWAAVTLTLENRAARGPEAYGVQRTLRATLASRTMRLTGLVVLAFLIYHLAHFTLGGVQTASFKENLKPYTLESEYRVAGFSAVAAGTKVLDVHTMVVQGFQHPVVALFYVIAVGLLSFHLMHGIDSMFQTLGWRTSRWATGLRKVALAFCVVYFLANAAIPGAVLTGRLQARPVAAAKP